MPTTSPFLHRGLLPFCAELVDVSVFDYWITLGGTTKGNSPTAAEIALSTVNASRLYWMLYSVTGVQTENTVATTFTANAADHLAAGVAMPAKRVCPDTGSNYGAQIDLEDGFPINNAACFYGPSGSIVRMYDGDTDETNFVGYGIKSDIDEAFVDYSGTPGIQFFYIGLPPDLMVYVCSYGNEPATFGSTDYAYTTFGGIPVLAVAGVWGGVHAGEVEIPDAANLTATIVTNGGADSLSLQLTGIEFYAL